MEIRHGSVRHELPDEWWTSAGMDGFVPMRAAFRAQDQPGVFDIAINDIRPVERNLSHGVFNDSGDKRGTARERVTNILTAFRTDTALAPVEVQRETDSPYRYSLYDGTHRLYCAIAAGFTAIPAVDVAERPRASDDDGDFDEWLRANPERIPKGY